VATKRKFFLANGVARGKQPKAGDLNNNGRGERDATVARTGSTNLSILSRSAQRPGAQGERESTLLGYTDTWVLILYQTIDLLKGARVSKLQRGDSSNETDECGREGRKGGE